MHVCMLAQTMLMSISIYNYVQIVTLIDRYPRKKLLKSSFLSIYIRRKGKAKDSFVKAMLKICVLCATHVLFSFCQGNMF
jgi:hypothetical protein